MIPITISLEPAVIRFYSHVAEAVQLPLEQVLSDALFKLAGELSLEALHRETENKKDRS
jgi:hypothetical protein